MEYEQVFVGQGTGRSVRYLEFNTSGSQLLSASEFGPVRVVDANSGGLIAHHKSDSPVSAVTFLESDDIFLAQYEGRVEIWTPEFSERRRVLEFDQMRRVAASDDAGHWGLYGERLFAWDGPASQSVDLPLAGQAWLQFFGSDYASGIGEHDGVVVTIDLDDLSTAEWQAPAPFIAGTPILPSPAFILMTEKGQLYRFNVDAQKVEFELSLSAEPSAIVAGPGDSWFAVVTPSQASIYGSRTGELRFSIPIEVSWTSMSATPDALLIGTEQGQIHSVDVESQKISTAEIFDSVEVSALQWHDETRRLAVGSRDGRTMVIEPVGW